MPKKKPEHEKAKKISISIPRAIWNLAEIRMFQNRQGDSEYVRGLIKKDTHDLWVQQNQTMPQNPLAAMRPESMNETPGNSVPLPHTGGEILKPHSQPDGGSGTHEIRYPKRPRGKSSQ